LTAAGPEMHQIDNIYWKRVNFYMAFGFILLGFINLYIMKFYDFDFWVNFKLYGVMIYNLVLTSSALFYLFSKAKNISDKDEIQA
jgi:intracellular septation protein